MILVIEVTRMSVHALTSEVVIRSTSHDLVGEEFRILRISSSDTGSKEDMAAIVASWSCSRDRH